MTLLLATVLYFLMIFQSLASGCGQALSGSPEPPVVPITPITIVKTWQGLTTTDPDHMDQSISAAVETVDNVFRLYSKNNFFQLPPYIWIELGAINYTFSYRTRTLRLYLETRVLSNAVREERIGFSEDTQKNRTFVYELHQVTPSIAHEVGHSLFEETLALHFAEAAKLIVLKDQYENLTRERESLVDQIKLPRNFSTLPEEEQVAIRKGQEVIYPRINECDAKRAKLRTAVEAYRWWGELIHPYNELFADLVVYAYTGSDDAIIHAMSLPWEEPLSHHSLRLFSNNVSLSGFSETGAYEILAPTRSWIGENLIQDPTKTDMVEASEKVLQAIIDTLKLRLTDRAFRDLNPAQMNSVLIQQLKRQ